MRRVVIPLVVLTVTVAMTSRTQAGLRCTPGKPNDKMNGCECPPEMVSIVRLNPTTDEQDFVCAAKPRARALSAPQLVEPADGAIGVTDDTDFMVRPPAGAESIRIEVCSDDQCRARTRVLRKPVHGGELRFRLAPLSSQETHWRVRGERADGPAGPTAMRSFTVVSAPAAVPPPGSTPAPARHVLDSNVVALALNPRSANAQLIAALKASQQGNCTRVLELYASPRDPDPEATPKLDQLAKDCRISDTNGRLIAAADAGDFDRVVRTAIDFSRDHPTDEALAISWGEAYAYAKRSPPDCHLARSYLGLAQLSIATDPGNIASSITAACGVEPASPPAAQNRRPISIYADSFYDVPITGQLAMQGAGLAAGIRWHLRDRDMASGRDEPRGTVGGGIVTVAPGTDGVDHRIGGFWGGEFHADVGMTEPTAVSVRLDGRVQLGRGVFVGPDGNHGAFVADMTWPGVSIKLRLAHWLRLAAHAGMHFGFAIDGGNQVDSGLRGFGDRWHGTIGFDAGVMLDTYFHDR